MEDNNKCPLCGKNINEEENFCHDCREIAQNSDLSEFISEQNEDQSFDSINDEQQTENSDDTLINSEVNDESQIPPKRRSNKKLLIFLAIGLILMIVIGGVSSYIFLNNKYAEETEIAYWNKCIEHNTPLAYSKYLVQYPDGKFSAEAEEKIIELRENERKEWDTLRKTNDIDVLFAFLTDHPQTPYSSEIKRLTDSLSWVAALKENTTESYKTYMENVKLGRMAGEYVDRAQERHDYLSQLVTVEGNELVEVKKVLTDYFKSLSSTKNKDMEKLITTPVEKFFNSENKTSEQIIDSLKNDMKSKRIKSVTYVPASDIREAIRDNKGIYFIKASVRKEVTFSDRKKKKEISDDVLNIVLNENKLIQSVSK